MENYNEEKIEKKGFPFFKVLLGIIAVAAIILAAFAVEKAIGDTVRDINISKSALSKDKITYYPVKPLDTRIMAVIASDGTVRLAFEECLNCYYNDGVDATFTDTGTSVICDNCGCETTYDNIGLLRDDCGPYPILNSYVIEDDRTITIQKDFLEQCGEMLATLRSGPGNYGSVYDDEEYMNMEITEGSDRAVRYDTDGGFVIPDQPVTLESLVNRSESILSLYTNTQSDVTMLASQEDIAAYDKLYKEFIELCNELDFGISAERMAEINDRFDEIQEGFKTIAGRVSE